MEIQIPERLKETVRIAALPRPAVVKVEPDTVAERESHAG
jgi:hypothetical protein